MNQLLFYIVLQSLASLFSLLTLLYPRQKDEGFLVTLVRNEIFIGCQWTFALPAFWIGKTLNYSVPILFLTGYLIGFIVQIFFVSLYLKQPLKVTDILSICIMMFGLYLTQQ